MSATAAQAKQNEGTTSPWQFFRTGLWQKEINVRDVEPPSAELVERVCAVFRAQGLKVY